MAPKPSPAGVRRPPGKPGAKPGGLRIAGFPWYVVVGGVVLAIGLGLMMRGKFGGTAQAATTGPPQAGGTGGSSDDGGAAGFAAAEPLWDIADSLFALTGAIGAGNFSAQNPGAVANAPGTGTSDATAPTAQLSPTVISSTPTGVSFTSPSQIGFFTTESGVKASNLSEQEKASVLSVLGARTIQGPGNVPTIQTVQPPARIPSPTNQQPFGGIVSTEKLKNGSILTTYASGRQVQQAPGKSAYVVRKGK